MSARTNHRSLARITPSEAGFSAERLNEIDSQMISDVEAQRIAGATGMIVRHGKIVFLVARGYRDREQQHPMQVDTLFRIYSMTKGVTGVAAMILFDEGKIRLEDAVSDYLPEFADIKVLERSRDSTGRTTHHLTDPIRPLTILDLMRHTAGLSYLGPRDQHGQYYFRELEVGVRSVSLEELVKRIARSPLQDQPGTHWRYGYATDVLGRLIEGVSGETLDRFFATRIFEPLEMDDTGFYAPTDKLDRLAVLYTPNDDDTVARTRSPAQDRFSRPAICFAGGEGLVSTTLDYARFCLMLLGQGQYAGHRVFSREASDMMTTDLIGGIQRHGGLLPDNTGFGLTFAVATENSEWGPAGTYSWGGAAGTRFWIDSKNEMFGIYMTQILPHENLTYGDDFRRMAYAAMT